MFEDLGDANVSWGAFGGHHAWIDRRSKDDLMRALRRRDLPVGSARTQLSKPFRTNSSHVCRFCVALLAERSHGRRNLQVSGYNFREPSSRSP